MRNIDRVFQILGINSVWDGESLEEAWKQWWDIIQNIMLRNIPPLLCWGVWLARNKSILRDNASSSSHIATYIVAIFSMMHSKVLVPTVQRIEVEEINQQIPWAYFDGACNDQGMCSGGIMLFLDSHHSLKSKVGLGREKQFCGTSHPKASGVLGIGTGMQIPPNLWRFPQCGQLVQRCREMSHYNFVAYL